MNNMGCFMKVIFFAILLAVSAVFPYGFAGGYHPVAHFTPHFSTPVHVSPHFSPAPHFSEPMPHFSPVPHYSPPATHFEPAHISPIMNPAHPLYWAFWHRNNYQPVTSGIGGQGGGGHWKLVLWVMAGIIAFMLLLWGCARLAR